MPSHLEVIIGGAVVTIARKSLQVRAAIGERSTATFRVIDRTAIASYQKGQPLEIWDLDDTLTFGGVVDTPGKQRAGSGLSHDIACIDYHYKADKRLVAESYEDKTAGYIVDDIFDKYLAIEGITIGEIQLGATITQAIFNYVKVSDCFDALAMKTGFIWEINESKELNFIDRATNAAPWAFTNLKCLSTPKLIEGNPLYRNRQYLRGGKGTTDSQTENRTGDGETKAFAMSFPLATVPTVTVAAAGQTVGIKGIDDAKDCYWSKGDAVINFDVAPANATALVFVYYGLYDILTLVEDTDEINATKDTEGEGSGYVEDISAEPKLTDTDAVLEAGEARLDIYAVAGKRFLYDTQYSGLRPGQLQSVTYSPFGFVDEEMLIESVVVRADGDYAVYSVVAIQGPVMGSWSRFFRGLASVEDIIFDSIDVGADQILIILKKMSENWGWGEAVTETVYACPLASVSTYPLTTLYPC